MIIEIKEIGVYSYKYEIIADGKVVAEVAINSTDNFIVEWTDGFFSDDIIIKLAKKAFYSDKE